jgi:micrococcal nuclease
VRYIGIDTPETAGSPEGAEPFGDEAAARNRGLVEDERVCLEQDASDVDRFDRLLRYVWLEDGRLVNEVLVAEGLADAVRFPPDTKRTETLEAAEARARRAGSGIWGD